MLCLSGFELYSRWVPLNCDVDGDKYDLSHFQSLLSQNELTSQIH